MQDDRMVAIKIEDAEVDSEKVWFFAFHFNGLYSKDLTNGEVQYWGAVPGEATEQMRLYASIKKMDHKVFLIPFEANELAVLELDSKQYIKINISKAVGYEKHIKYMGVVLYGEAIYIFGLTEPIVVKVDVNTYAVELVGNFRQMLEEVNYSAENIYFRKQIIEIDGKLYAPFCLANMMIELDCNTMQSKRYIIGKEQQGYAGISSDDGITFYFTPMFSDGDIIKWHKDKGILARRASGRNNKEFAYTGVCKVREDYVLFPADYRACDEKQLAHNMVIADGNYTFSKQNNDMVIAYETNKNVVCLWDENGEKKEIDVLVPVKYAQEAVYTLHEKEGAALDYFIEIVEKKDKEQKKDFKDMYIGENIYTTLTV